MKIAVEKLSDQAYKVTVNVDMDDMTFRLYFSEPTSEAGAVDRARSHAEAFLATGALCQSLFGWNLATGSYSVQPSQDMC